MARRVRLRGGGRGIPVLFVKYLVFLANTLVCAPVAILLSFLDREARLAYLVTRFWVWSILRLCGVRLRVQGLENLDQDKAYVFMSNHSSNLDAAVLVAALKRYQLRWVAKKELVRVPFFGWALKATKHVIIDRSDQRRAIESLRRAQEKISRGISVIFFPEGTRSRDGTLLPFKKGGFVFAIETGAPIVPVTVNGTGRMLPRGSWRPEPGEVEVIVGKPIEPSRYGPASKEKLMEEVRNAILAGHRLQMRGGC